MRIETERKMKRWREQRWILDQVIQTRGIDWDQGRTGKIIRNCGPGVEKDLQELQPHQKFCRHPARILPPPRGAKNRGTQAEAAGNFDDARDTITSPRVSTPTPCGRFTKTAMRSASLGTNARALLR